VARLLEPERTGRATSRRGSGRSTQGHLGRRSATSCTWAVASTLCGSRLVGRPSATAPQQLGHHLLLRLTLRPSTPLISRASEAPPCSTSRIHRPSSDVESAPEAVLCQPELAPRTPDLVWPRRSSGLARCAGVGPSVRWKWSCAAGPHPRLGRLDQVGGGGQWC